MRLNASIRISNLLTHTQEINMTEQNRHIAFICSKGDLDMAYPALIMGWAALGNGIDGIRVLSSLNLMISAYR